MLFTEVYPSVITLPFTKENDISHILKGLLIIIIALYYALISKIAFSHFFSPPRPLFYMPNFLIRTWQQGALPKASWELVEW
jgi:hypothetical protein